MAGAQPQGTRRAEGRGGLAAIVMVLAMFNKPNQLMLLLNVVGLKYFLLSKGVFHELSGRLLCWSL